MDNRGGPSTFSFLKWQRTQLPLNPYPCTSRLMHFFPCSKKLYCAVSGGHYPEPQLIKVRRTSDSGVLSLTGFPHHIRSSNFRWYPGRGSIKITHGEGLQRNCLSGMTELLYTWTHHCCGCMHKTAQHQASPHPRPEVRRTHEILHLTEQLLASVGCVGERVHFLQECRPCSSGCPYIHAPTGSTD